MNGYVKVLNGYGGLGANTLNWDRNKYQVDHVEINEEIAEECRRIHPEDKVIETDAHEYLKNNFREYDFIWLSPPCQTHSQMHLLSAKDDSPQNKDRNPEYPDMRLYQEIIFLKNFFDGDWVVENVNPYYEPLIKPQKCGRHMIWSNFTVPDVKIEKDFDFKSGTQATRKQLEEWLGIGLKKNIYLGDSHDPGQVLRNCVHPKVGEAIMNARKTKQESVVSFGETDNEA